jgi:preprotein translocase subunit SecG
METTLLAISIILIIIVLLQSGKAQSAAAILTGAQGELFKHRKERGAELFITRVTWCLGMSFFLISLAATFM